MVTKNTPIDLFYPMNAKGKKAVPKVELNADEELLKLGKRLKELRIQRGYTSYEYFAYEHNISRAQYGRYEQGKDLRYSSLIKVISAFGMTLDEFFAEGF